MRHADDVGEHAAVLDAGERLHPVVGEHGILVAVRRVPRGTRPAGAAAHLKRDDRALSHLKPAHAVAELDDLGDALVAERERLTRRKEPRREEEIDVAARDRERTDERLAVTLEPRLGNVAPFDRVWAGARELFHR